MSETNSWNAAKNLLDRQKLNLCLVVPEVLIKHFLASKVFFLYFVSILYIIYNYLLDYHVEA